MAHRLVAIEQREHGAGREGTEDDLQAELLGDGGERDQQHDRAADADLGDRVLQAQQVLADAHRALGAAHDGALRIAAPRSRYTRWRSM